MAFHSNDTIPEAMRTKSEGHLNSAENDDTATFDAHSARPKSSNDDSDENPPVYTSLYERPLDITFPMNFDSSAKRIDYSGNGDSLSVQARLLRMAWFEYAKSIQSPWTSIGLCAFITGQARAMDPSHPRPTRLCFAARTSSGNGPQCLEIRAALLNMIEEYFPSQDFPELYPLIIRYFFSYVVLL